MTRADSNAPSRRRRQHSAMIEPLEARRLLSGRVVGYFPEYRWSFFNNIDWEAVTHINYFSISANSDGSLATGNVNLSHLNTARATAHSHGDTISIVVGPQSFTTIASSPAATANFVNNLVQFALSHNLDGIDIDWEPRPTGSTITAFGNLIDALHAQTSQHNLKLTAAVYPNHQHIPLPATEKLDWINIMAYNFSYADHSTYTHSINSLLGWHNYGVPRDKLLLGIPFYGREGTSWSDTSTRIYRTIIDNHVAANGSYPSPDSNLVDGYYINGVDTVRDKAEYVANNGYGGVMIWELGQDHVDGSGNFTPMSLLPVIKSVITDPVPLEVSSGQFQFTTAPHKLQFTFTRDVGGSLHPSDLTVRDALTQASILVTSVAWDAATRTASFTLNNVVPDGHYRATLSGSGVTDSAGNPLGDDYVFDFSFLLGDANGDGVVNLQDFNILASNFGQSPRDYTQGDFNYDGQVTLADFNLFAARFGLTLPARPFSGTAITSAAKTDRIIDTLED